MPSASSDSASDTRLAWTVIAPLRPDALAYLVVVLYGLALVGALLLPLADAQRLLAIAFVAVAVVVDFPFWRSVRWRSLELGRDASYRLTASGASAQSGTLLGCAFRSRFAVVLLLHPAAAGRPFRLLLLGGDLRRVNMLAATLAPAVPAADLVSTARS